MKVKPTELKLDLIKEEEIRFEDLDCGTFFEYIDLAYSEDSPKSIGLKVTKDERDFPNTNDDEEYYVLDMGDEFCGLLIEPSGLKIVRVIPRLRLLEE